MIKKLYEANAPKPENRRKKGLMHRDFSRITERDVSEKKQRIFSDILKDTYSRLIDAADINGGNYVFSPVAIIRSMIILSVVTDGNTRKQISDALGIDEVELLKLNEFLSERLAVYYGGSELNIAGSIWTNTLTETNDEAIKELCEDYGFSAFEGTMGTAEVNQEIGNWINSNTGGLLERFASQIQTQPDQLLSMISTVYLKSQWDCQFYDEDTKKRKFHISENESITCDFMNARHFTDYYEGKGFSAINNALSGEMSMHFILPAEGVSMSDIAESREVMELVCGDKKGRYSEYDVSMAIPKFDITAGGNIGEMLKRLGITDVFDMNVSDFSPITDEKEIFLSNAMQSTRLKVDETGVEGASVVIMDCIAGGLPPELQRKKFVLDRPFVFAVTKEDIPVFYGVVRNPAE